jgi:predicted RNA-binding protein with PIN domain
MAAQDLGPLRLRVPEPGKDADSVIREIVEQSPRPSELIVVTSDKALYSYVKTLGASVLRAHEWNALERKSSSRETGDAAAEKPDREDDVEGWLRRFGADEDSGN